jgi:hypothetical protein
VKLKCIKKITILGTALICIECEKTHAESNKVEQIKEVNKGFCRNCIKKLSMDSIKNTIWDLGY